MQREEIPSEETYRYASELRDVVETICANQPFKTSPKSCEFLRHIVHHALNGSIDELKERLIGIALLGRESTYDTGSDAGVRVRANDVRKRLNAYNSANDAHAEFILNLPAGSYLPRFFRNVDEAKTLPVSELIPPFETTITPTFENSSTSQTEQAIDTCDLTPESDEQWSPLSLQQVAIPTLVALFLCTICIRWQLGQEHPFTTFWQTVLQDHHAILCVPLSKVDGQADGQQLISMQGLTETAPLLNLAGQFHAEFALTTSPATARSATDILVSIISGAAEESSAFTQNGNRLAIEETPTGRRVVDRSMPNRRVVIPGPAALLTISNGHQHSIRIDGTDDEAISRLIRTLCERNGFPDELADSLQSGTVTQLVLPMAAHAEAVVFHEPLTTISPAMAQTR